MGMSKQEASCSCFRQISNGTNAYYLACASDGDHSGVRHKFKTKEERVAHFEKNCRKKDAGCKLYQPVPVRTTVADDSPVIPSPTESSVSTQTTELLASDQSTVSTTIFDYSQLDHDTADFVMEKTRTIMQIRTATILTTGRELLAVREKLAMRKSGTWQQWCRSIGMSDDSATRYIRAFEYITDNCGDMAFAEKIQPSLLFEVSRPTAPPELQEQVLAGKVTSHKEYLALQEQLRLVQNAKTEIAELLESAERRAKANELDLGMERKRLADREVDLHSISEKLRRAEAEKGDPQELRKLRVQLEAQTRQVEKLRQELQQEKQRPPLEVAAVTKEIIEVFPPAVQARINELEQQIEELGRKPSQEEIQHAELFRLSTNGITKAMGQALAMVNELAGKDPGSYQQLGPLKTAFFSFVVQMETTTDAVREAYKRLCTDDWRQ